MELVLYKLEKTKIAFERHHLFDAKLCQSTFNYSKFHETSHFVYYIWDYSSIINYDIAHNKTAH